MAVKFPAYIRTYGTSDYEYDIDNYIECLERHYKVKLRDRPACIQMVNSVKSGIKACRRQLREARKRKAMIIQKLLHEITWEPPFERMMRRGESVYIPAKPPITQCAVAPFLSPITHTPSPATLSTKYTDYSPPSPLSYTALKHPNTAVQSPQEDLKPIVSEAEVTKESSKESSTTVTDPCPLPMIVETNIHRTLSPFQSFEKIKCVNPPKEEHSLEVIQPAEWELLDEDTCVRVILRRHTKGVFEFSLLNACRNTLRIYYRGLTDTSFFRSGKMHPRYMVRLVPGLSQFYEFKFTLEDDVEDILSSLFFKVAKTKPRYYSNPLGPFQALLIPLSEHKKGRTVIVSESVNIPPAYSWHLKQKYGYPFGLLQITSKDSRTYFVEIVKCADYEDKVSTSTLIGPESMTDSPTSPTKKGKKGSSKDKVKSLSTTEVVAPIIEEIVDSSLEPFLFQRTYLIVPPNKNRSVRVYFTKAWYVGLHQGVYTVKFFDPVGKKLIFTKTVVIYTESLPMPIVINPHSILDLTETPLCHGYCEDHFSITNTHNLYGSMIKIRLTTKLEKLITIDPMEVEIPRKSTINFKVRFCTRDFIRNCATDKPIEYYAHFTIKINVSGMDAVYRGFPTIFYEIIAPCITDYTKVYKHELTPENLL